MSDERRVTFLVLHLSCYRANTPGASNLAGWQPPTSSQSKVPLSTSLATLK
jgi:hypothetical protein